MKDPPLDKKQPAAFRHVGDVLRDILKETDRRAELRQRLEAERGGPITRHARNGYPLLGGSGASGARSNS